MSRDVDENFHPIEIKHKIRRLPGAKLAPETVLAQALEEIENIEGVIIGVLYKDSSTDVDWSAMSRANTCYVLENMRRVMMNQIFGKAEGGE